MCRLMGRFMVHCDFSLEKKYDHVMGANEAPVTIIAYESLTCSHCRDFTLGVFPEIHAEFVAQDQARFVLREVYFDAAALLAGSVLRVLDDTQYFDALDSLYLRQSLWLSSRNFSELQNALLSFGVERGAQEADILEAMQDQEMAQALLDHSKYLVEESQLQGTPTLFVNEEKVPDWSFETVSNYLRREIVTQA